MAQIKCTDSLIIPFFAMYVVPATFELEDATLLSIAVSTDGLIVYKDVVDYPVASIDGPCDTTVENVSVKLGQVKVSGTINYRVAGNGLKTDPLIIPPALKDKVNVDDNIWSSADGFVEVKDGTDNFMTVGFIKPDEDVDPALLTVTLKSFKHTFTTEDEQTKDQIVYLQGEFELGYGLV